jgi:transcriptional regulator with XRE-family HTH domain
VRNNYFYFVVKRSLLPYDVVVVNNGGNMSQQIETKLAYIIRKLNDPAYNNQALCNKTKLTPATVSLIASGKTKNPSYETVEKIAKYFQELK